MISYLQTIPFSNYFKSLISIITFYYRRIVSKQQFSLKIISLNKCWMFRRIQVFDRPRKCHLNCTKDQTVYVSSYDRLDFYSVLTKNMSMWCQLCISARRLVCIGQTNSVIAPSVYPSLYIWNNEIITFVLLQSLFTVESNNTCFRWFIMRWFDYWYTLGKEEISTDCRVGHKEKKNLFMGGFLWFAVGCIKLFETAVAKIQSI